MITVYWCAKGEAGMRARPPEPAIQLARKNRESAKTLDYMRCPAFRDVLKNVVGVSSYYSYDIKQEVGGDISTSSWGQKFFDSKVIKRDSNTALHSFLMEYIFFTEEESLIARVTPSYFEDNTFNSSAILVPGAMDIGKYFRNLECAFHIRGHTDTMDIKEGDVYMYVALDTEETVVYKEFLWTETLNNYLSMVLGAREHRVSGYQPLKYFYGLFKRVGLKKRILKEIKANLCEGT